ncbi:MAG TPA: hypothetical protein IAA29_00690 [Candidatus Paenibacillus intestinavium]|nr:hypothetical protein [Candidatus Paenibacillus intestinavium]
MDRDKQKTYELKAFVHLYDGIRTRVENQTHTVEASSESVAEKKVYEEIANHYRSSQIVGLSSITTIEIKEIVNDMETHGKWTKESVWLYRNDRGEIIRVQDDHPSVAVKLTDRIDRVSKGLSVDDIPIDKKKLTPAQSRVYRYLVEFVSINGFTPSIREIAAGVKLKSSSTAHGHLERLEKKGYIQRVGDKGNTRSIKLL